MSTPTPPLSHPTGSAEVLSLYLRLVPAGFVQQLQHQAGVRQNHRVYTFLVVMWLLIVQRLHGGTSLEAAIDRLPAESVLVGDCNFGVFSAAYAAQQHRHATLLRLTEARAQRLAGEPLRDGIDRPVVWRPSREDRKSHPQLPADACVPGRLIVRQVQPDNGAAPFLLALFTTLGSPQEELLDLYGRRWCIETDLRTLKSTLHLDQLSCTTPDMVAKELNLAMAAYNLVRAVTCLAAERSGLPPRGFSFTRVRRVIEAFTPLVAAAKSQREARRYFELMMYYVGQAKLPQRRRRRPSYPRAVWSKGESFPSRKA